MQRSLSKNLHKWKYQNMLLIKSASITLLRLTKKLPSTSTYGDTAAAKQFIRRWELSDYDCAQKPNSCLTERSPFCDLQIKLRLLSIWTPTECTHRWDEVRFAYVPPGLNKHLHCLFRNIPKWSYRRGWHSFHQHKDALHPESVRIVGSIFHKSCKCVSTLAWNRTNTKVSCWAFVQSCSGLRDTIRKFLARGEETMLSTEFSLFLLAAFIQEKATKVVPSKHTHTQKKWLGVCKNMFSETPGF